MVTAHPANPRVLAIHHRCQQRLSITDLQAGQPDTTTRPDMMAKLQHSTDGHGQLTSNSPPALYCTSYGDSYGERRGKKQSRLTGTLFGFVSVRESWGSFDGCTFDASVVIHRTDLFSMLFFFLSHTGRENFTTCLGRRHHGSGHTAHLRPAAHCRPSG